MLIKFETKSARVKAISFHPKRPWILASLHNGVIQLWDYDEKTIMEKFDEHKGPVRGLDFHMNQPLFVSGGDDAKIKVWNYRSKRCLFTLDAHEDYIRTTFFHHEEPWIVSSSDDQSIRIWNWINRTRINLLTGHTHYVMCAQFHPANDLILSASIDQTLRLWDVSGLRKKSSSSNSKDQDAGLPEILIKTDYSVESKDAHNSEINWCCFHPDSKKQLCLSTSDDTYIKLWKIDPRGLLREVDTLRGHYNHVNCAIFHPKKDLILSASDDRSIRVWDIEKRSALCTHRKEVDRFWTLAAHPNENLFAAGHDNGLLLFKLERERPVFCVVKEFIIYIKNNQLFHHNMRSKENSQVLVLKNKTELTHHYYRLHSHNYSDNQASRVLLSTRSVNLNSSIYDLFKIPPNSNNAFKNVDQSRVQGLTAVFIGKNKYAVLDKSKVVFVYDEHDRKTETSIEGNEIFDAGTKRLFVKNKVDDQDSLTLYDMETLKAIGSVKFDPKFVIMSQNRKYVACIKPNTILICDGDLNILSTINEHRKIKSAVWDETGVLIYNTPVHIKYALTDGETTTLRCVDQTFYLIAIKANILFYINRACDIKRMEVFPAEFRFKQAVIKKKKKAILSALKELKTPTRAEISFLVKKGYSDIALRFVKDPKTRFNLAIKAQEVDVALECASKINEKWCWQQLAETSEEIGNVIVRERALKELREPYKLALLYWLTDQREKLIEARDMAREMSMASIEFYISVLLRDVKACNEITKKFHPSLPLMDGSLWDNQEPNVGNYPPENWPQQPEDDEEEEEEIVEEDEGEFEEAIESSSDEPLHDEMEESEEEILDIAEETPAPPPPQAKPGVAKLKAQMRDWEVEDVVKFIESDQKIKKYAPAFADNQVDGNALIEVIDGDTLKMLLVMFKAGPAFELQAVLSKYKG